MPTVNGRQAIVIFPPGDQSLKDIEYMGESQGDDWKPHIHMFRRFVVTENGAAKFWLQAI